MVWSIAHCVPLVTLNFNDVNIDNFTHCVVIILHSDIIVSFKRNECTCNLMSASRHQTVRRVLRTRYNRVGIS